MNIAAINASPKANGSASGLFIGRLGGILDERIDVHRAAQLIRPEYGTAAIPRLLAADALLIVFPLYVDSLPATLIKLLTCMEAASRAASYPPATVYAVCNCGFYEAEHTRLALRMVRHFALRAGLIWGCGLGVGCGPLSAELCAKTGPAANVHAALCALGEAIRGKGPRERGDIFVVPNIPRFLYKAGGNMSWRQAGRKNGVQNRLRARPHG